MNNQIKKIKVSFDFDSTLSKPNIQEYAKSLIEKGIEVHIVTDRFEDTTRCAYTNEYLFNVVNKLGINKNNIHFSHLNATDSDLPGADLLIIKDVLQHLPNKDIRKILAKTKTFRYVLITNDYTLNNSDCAIGDYRGLNLLVKPFVLDSEIVFTKKLNFDRGIVKEVILMKNEDLV